MKDEDPTIQAESITLRISSLLVDVLLFGFIVGLLSETIVSLVSQTNRTILIVLIPLLCICILALIGRFLANEIALTTRKRLVGTAFAISKATDTCVPPHRLKMSPRYSGPYPFPIMSIVTHLQLRGNQVEELHSLTVEALCSLLKAFSEKLEMFDDFSPYTEKLDRGPFLANKSGIRLKHIRASIDDIAPSILDTAFLRKFLSFVSFELPEGVSMKVTISGARPLISIESPGIALKVEEGGRQSAPAGLSPWKRKFAAPTSELSLIGISFRVTLTFGGAGLLKRRGVKALPAWSFGSRLEWFQQVYDWIATYLDWLESDDEIPEDHLFELVEDYPPHYRYSRGAVPPGNGHIVFGIE
jgi:hypothetical protein